MSVWTEKYSFLDGVGATQALAFFALSYDAIETSHSQIAFWQNGKWGNSGQVEFTVVSCSVCFYPVRQMVVIGAFGEVFLTGSGDFHEERIGTGSDAPEYRGPLRRVRGIAGKAYATGMQRQVYRRDGINVWTCIDHDMRSDRDQVVGFESIDGYSDNDIYAVGWEGEIWHFDGMCWLQKTSPTNFILTDVCCAEDGNVYVCGRMGLLLRGRDDQWQNIEHGSLNEDIWSLAWFDNALYVATYRGIFRLSDLRLIPVEFDTDFPVTTYRLSVSDNVLWSIGAKDVMSFDGKTWTRID